MNIEECIIEFKKMIERDKDTLRYWKSDTFGHYDEPIKKLEKDVLISETLLTAYEKEKEKNKELEDTLKQTQNSWFEDTKVIEKQSKEIEELKQDNEHQWEERCKLTFELENSTSNDKIKAKIEDLKENSNGDDFNLTNVIMILQSLLEKE